MIHKATQKITVRECKDGTQRVYVDGVLVEGDAVIEFRGFRFTVENGKICRVEYPPPTPFSMEVVTK